MFDYISRAAAYTLLAGLFSCGQGKDSSDAVRCSLIPSSLCDDVRTNCLSFPTYPDQVTPESRVGLADREYEFCKQKCEGVGRSNVYNGFCAVRICSVEVKKCDANSERPPKDKSLEDSFRECMNKYGIAPDWDCQSKSSDHNAPQNKDPMCSNDLRWDTPTCYDQD